MVFYYSLTFHTSVGDCFLMGYYCRICKISGMLENEWIYYDYGFLRAC